MNSSVIKFQIEKMLSQNLIKRLGRLSVRALSTDVPSPTYGDNKMPDKLYKVIELEVRSSEKAVMKSYVTFIESTASHLGLTIGKIWSRPKPEYTRWSILKAVHVQRKHLVQYEVRTHYTWIHLLKLTGSTADTVLEYIQRMLPEGVGLKVTRVSVEPLPKYLNSSTAREVIHEQ